MPGCVVHVWAVRARSWMLIIERAVTFSLFTLLIPNLTHSQPHQRNREINLSVRNWEIFNIQHKSSLLNNVTNSWTARVPSVLLFLFALFRLLIPFDSIVCSLPPLHAHTHMYIWNINTHSNVCMSLFLFLKKSFTKWISAFVYMGMKHEYSILGFISFSLYLSVIPYCFPRWRRF